jgi:hypothetical protein
MHDLDSVLEMMNRSPEDKKQIAGIIIHTHEDQEMPLVDEDLDELELPQILEEMDEEESSPDMRFARRIRDSITLAKKTLKYFQKDETPPPEA